ncbi:class IV adenylate cyclase [Micromonospora fluostatini]|uniref:class IV adenylate cyclase n=1 Tax=Micromonospora sp. JCM 30529 TaxID=3421643 RepID=UPI003D183E62
MVEVRVTQEIEVKYRVLDEDALLAALRVRGVVLSAPVIQDDQAFAPVGWRYGMSKRGVPFGRLRTQEGRHLFTVKRPVSNELVCVEHETVVADREQMHGALLVMGFAPTVRIVKSRRVGSWGDATVCVDVVDGLGVFVEVEALVAAGGSGEATQERLHGWVCSWGVPVERVTETYDSLLRAGQG